MLIIMCFWRAIGARAMNLTFSQLALNELITIEVVIITPMMLENFLFSLDFVSAGNPSKSSILMIHQQNPP